MFTTRISRTYLPGRGVMAQRYWRDVCLSISQLCFPLGLASHSRKPFPNMTVLYDIRWVVDQLKALEKQEHIFLCVSGKGLRIVSPWPNLGRTIIFKLIMVAKGIDCSHRPWGYVSKLGVKGGVNHSHQAWRRNSPLKGNWGTVTRRKNGRLDRHS